LIQFHFTCIRWRGLRAAEVLATWRQKEGQRLRAAAVLATRQREEGPQVRIGGGGIVAGMHEKR